MKVLITIAALFAVVNADVPNLIATNPNLSDPGFGVDSNNRTNNITLEERLPRDYHACYVGSYVVPKDGFPDNITALQAKSDTVALALCSGANSTCITYNYTLTLPEGMSVQIITGDCVAENMTQYYTCDALKNATANVGDIYNCKETPCTERACNEIQVPRRDEKRCPQTPEDDIQLMPACTMQEFGIRLNTCHNMLYSGYPYTSEAVCRNNLNKAMQCLATSIYECSDSQCESVIDFIPGGKSYLELIRNIALAGMDSSADEILDLIGMGMNIPDALKLILKRGYLQFECPSPGKVPDIIESWFEWAQNTDVDAAVMQWAKDNLGWEMQEYSPCMPGYHSNNVKIHLDYLMQFYNSRTRAGVCEAWTTKELREMNNFFGKCDLDKFDDWVRAILPGGFKVFTPEIVKAFAILGYGLEQNRITDCPEGTTQDVGCERFYRLETACGIRKAWMCDYTQWKTSFLFDWLNEFADFEIENILSDVSLTFPSCDMFDMSDMCKNVGQQVCGTVPVTNCTTCYCMDQEYKDLSGLSEMWRKDYVEWRQVFNDYKTAFKQSTCHETLSRPDISLPDVSLPDMPDDAPEDTPSTEEIMQMLQDFVDSIQKDDKMPSINQIRPAK